MMGIAHMLGGGGLFGLFLLPALVAAAAALFVLSAERPTRASAGWSHVDEAVEIVRQRFARGEIDAEEYNRVVNADPHPVTPFTRPHLFLPPPCGSLGMPLPGETRKRRDLPRVPPLPLFGGPAERHGTGIIVGIPRRKPRWPPMRTALIRSLRFMRAYIAVAVAAVVAVLLAGVADLVAPQILRLIVDRGIRSGDMRQIAVYCAALVGVAALGGLATFLQGYWSAKASHGAAFDMRDAVFGKLQELSFSYHDRARTGELITRVTSDVDLVRDFVGGGLVQAISAALLLLGAIALLFVHELAPRARRARRHPGHRRRAPRVRAQPRPDVPPFPGEARSAQHRAAGEHRRHPGRQGVRTRGVRVGPLRGGERLRCSSRDSRCDGRWPTRSRCCRSSARSASSRSRGTGPS